MTRSRVSPEVGKLGPAGKKLLAGPTSGWAGLGLNWVPKKKSKPQKVFRELKLIFFDVCLTWTPHLHHIFAMSGPMKAEKIC